MYLPKTFLVFFELGVQRWEENEKRNGGKLGCVEEDISHLWLLYVVFFFTLLVG